MSEPFRALVVDQADGNYRAEFRKLSLDALPEGDVLIRVVYSSLNYKDGLAITNRGPILRAFPFVPGIDVAGVVVASDSPRFQPGDEVIATGWGIGERHWGGFAQYARLKSDWLMRLPAGMSLETAMAFGTAGLTAALCVLALEAHDAPVEGRETVVTGAAGGVGSIAVALLAQRGVRVMAVTGRTHEAAYLRALGASDILDRASLSTPSSRPLESARWGGAVDTVGGVILGNLLRQMAYGASVAACGNAAGAEVPTTVYPFILRAVNLLGIDSVNCPMPRRERAFALLAAVPADLVRSITRVAPLSELPQLAHEIVEGRVRGRIVIDVNA
ncbi:MAG: MDR family oxidoreductase [Chloroflexota bacterium]|nr:oxidoreductase [Dehalococcoidia bacterium]MDW8253426.1 MDR family oxidoreductase [Chloroflexota bacterium]